MTDLIRDFTSSLLQLNAGLVQCTGWLVLICLPKTEKIFEKRLDKLLAGFEIPEKDGKEDYLSPWRFTSDDGRFEMGFQPVMDRSAEINLGILCSNQHQVFGRFTGTAVLDDGKKIDIRDFMGFAEKVRNKW